MYERREKTGKQEGKKGGRERERGKEGERMTQLQIDSRIETVCTVHTTPSILLFVPGVMPTQGVLPGTERGREERES